jgi:glycosyltransferase involved in cell wall biosynthesis
MPGEEVLTPTSAAPAASAGRLIGQRRLRVLHVIPAVADRYGGPSRAVLDMGRALAELEVDVLIATTDADGPGRLPVGLDRPVTYQEVPAIFFSRQWSEALKYSRPLARWLDAHVPQFDVVHIHAVFSHACLAAARASRRHRVPYVVSAHGMLDRWSLEQKRLRKRVLWHAGAGQMLRGAAAVHYTTLPEQESAEGPLGLDRGVVIPLGVDERGLQIPGAAEAFRRDYPELGQDPFVLFLARLHPKKGPERLLQAFHRLAARPELSDWRLVLAGDGEPGYVAALKRSAGAARGAERVVFTGWLGAAQKAGALQGAALLALPSYQENFGLSVTEAMVCGVPVLVSPQVNLAAEIRAAGAGWVAGADEPALTQALGEALGDPEARRRRGEAGRALALARFTWPPVAAQLARLYGTLARRAEAVRR